MKISDFDSSATGNEMAEMTARADLPPVRPAPANSRPDGPHRRLVLRGATLIDGTGAGPWSRVDIVVENEIIAEIVGVGAPGLQINPARRPAEGDREIDCHGKFVTPGFIDCHVHTGTPLHALMGDMPSADYVYKLWLAHGVTTVRDMGSFNGIDWTISEKRRSQAHEIAAPHIQAYAYFPAVNDMLKIIHSPEEADAWLTQLAAKGADGVKFFGAPPAIMKAALARCGELGLRSGCHHAQQAVTRVNALTTAGWGLTSSEHFYGLPEALFEGRTIQDYPAGYDYADEFFRFTEAGRSFAQATEPGSAKWESVLQQFLDLDFTFVPTYTAYDTARDVMRARRADWHDAYTDPNLWAYYQPKREGHAAYWHAWSVNHEIDWKQHFRKWMLFINDFKNRGGRVCTGSDAGFVFQTYGFAYVRELELLQEAGFNALEVLRSATIQSAELLGLAQETGSVEVGKRADLLVHDYNPLEDFKLLYGTGALRLNDVTGAAEFNKCLRYTIKGGEIFAVDDLLADVRSMVADRQAAGLGAERVP